MEDKILNDRTVIEIGIWFIGILLIVIAFLYKSAENKKEAARITEKNAEIEYRNLKDKKEIEYRDLKDLAMSAAYVTIKDEVKGIREDIKTIITTMNVEHKEIRGLLNKHESKLTEHRMLIDIHTEQLKNRS